LVVSKWVAREPRESVQCPIVNKRLNMSIIHRYLTVQISKYFGIVLALVISIYVAVDFFENIDNFMGAGLPFSKFIIFLIFEIPFIVTQTTPICILLSVLIVFGLMIRSNEMMALKSGGVSAYYLLRPVLAIGVFLCILVFFLSELIVPITIIKANRIWREEVKNKPASISREKDIWIKANRSIYNIKYYNHSNSTIFGITLYYFDDDFRLTRRVDAKQGAFGKEKWFFHDVMEQKLDTETGNYRVIFHADSEEYLSVNPEDLKKVAKKAEEMNLFELLSYIKDIESEGYDASSYKVDLHAKLSFPFVCLIMCLVGTAITNRRIIKENLSANITYGIGIALLYWIFNSFCLSLGYGEMLPPLIAAWAANFVFICFGLIALLYAA